MACHEISALRLGLMKCMGVSDDAAKTHDEKEIGETLQKDGPIKSLANANNLQELKSFYQSSLSELEKRVSESKDESELPYLRSLIILTKKVELELENALNNLNSLYKGLDEIHDYVHEVYPAK